MKTHFLTLLRYLILTTALNAANAQASFISGVSATTDFTSNVLGNINHIVDGSGLSSLSFSATHAAANGTNIWAGVNGGGVTGSKSGIIDFNLNGTYSLSQLYVWNYNAGLSRGVKDLTIETSIDGSNYSALAGAPLLFAIGTSGAGELAQQFTFTPTTAAYVRFNIATNYGATDATGLAEVAFNSGNPVFADEPSVFALFAVAAVGLMVRRRVVTKR